MVFYFLSRLKSVYFSSLFIFQVCLFPTMPKWRRPENVPLPKVWRRFQGKILEDGRYNQYRIQEVTEDMVEDVLEHMKRYFLISECISSSIGLVEDEVSLGELICFWRETLKQQLTVVALVEEEGEDGKEKTRIAGVNVLYISEPNDEKSPELSGKTALKVFSVLDSVDKESKTFQRHKDIKACLKGLGLSVSPAYQKDNVGYELLKVRDDLCQTLDIPVTGTIFTGPASQYLAAKAGFRTIVEHKYGDFLVNGEMIFPRIANMSVKFMEKVYYSD
uniref:N-acetyltransferase domain-containing protein n=2 Tax=Clastoptera arizonana TaxID=38151 RepID=A0A1B6C5H1_9HEMI